MAERYSTAYKLRGILMAPLYLFMMTVFFHEMERDAVIWPVGAGLFLEGVLIRIWTQMHLHYRLRVRKKLTTTGPYSIIRNPIYIANTTMLLGLTVMSELLWFLPVTLVWCMVVYSLVVRHEEAHLLEKYDKPYVEYVKTVPRWLPRLGQRVAASEDTRSFLWPSIVAELHCFLLFVPVIGKEVFSILN